MDYHLFLFPEEVRSGEITFDHETYELGKNALKVFFDNGLTPPSIFAKNLKPGERQEIAIGSLYPRPPKFEAVLPNELFTGDRAQNNANCIGSENIIASTDSTVSIGLKLVYRDKCFEFPCGVISYPEP